MNDERFPSKMGSHGEETVPLARNMHASAKADQSIASSMPLGLAFCNSLNHLSIVRQAVNGPRVQERVQEFERSSVAPDGANWMLAAAHCLLCQHTIRTPYFSKNGRMRHMRVLMIPMLPRADLCVIVRVAEAEERL